MKIIKSVKELDKIELYRKEIITSPPGVEDLIGYEYYNSEGQLVSSFHPLYQNILDVIKYKNMTYNDAIKRLTQ